MSAYNSLQTDAPCSNCGITVPLEIQFKFGDTWQHVYHVGDTLRWGGNDIGEPGHAHVLVEGVAGPCPQCGARYLEYDIVVERDAIRSVVPVGTEREKPAERGFVITDSHDDF